MGAWINPTLQGQDSATRTAFTSLNKQLREGVPQYAARSYRAAALAVAGAPATVLVATDTTSYDYNSNLSAGIYTVPVTGLYDISGHAAVLVNSNPDEFELNVWNVVSGTPSSLLSSGSRYVIRGGTGGDIWGLVVADRVLLTVGATIGLYVNHIQGGNATNFSVASPNHNYFAIARVPV
jgi:hypothetical protein